MVLLRFDGTLDGGEQMKKFLEIMALAAVLFFTAFTEYRQDIRESSKEMFPDDRVCGG